MRRIFKDLFFLAIIATASAFLVWFPFAFLEIGQGMLTVFANYDGPNYIIIAKTLYNKAKIASSFSLPIPPEYYPAHFPAYPFLIRLFNFLLPGTWAMLTATLIPTIWAVWIFYLLLKKFKLCSSPFWLAVVFLFLPGRWLANRSVGSPEPLFIFGILASIYFFKSAFTSVSENLISKKKIITIDFLLAGLFGALAQITKTPGILLFVAYFIFLFLSHFKPLMLTNLNYNKIKKITWQAWPLLLIPFSALGVFAFYKFQTGDFLAYFHSGDNFHLVFPPFQSFVTGRNWLGDFWLEDMVWQYLIEALAVIQLIKLKHFDLAAFAGIFFLATLFISHRDLSRYSLPLMPFALIAFSRFLQKKEFKIAFFFILIPIYLYAINFILHNTAPIADWTPYL